MKQKNAAGKATRGQITEMTPRAKSPKGHHFCHDERGAGLQGVEAKGGPPYSREPAFVNEFGAARFGLTTFDHEAALYSPSHTSYGPRELSDRTQDHGTRSRTIAATYRGN